MAVKMKKLGQEDSEEQKPLNKAVDTAKAFGNTMKTFAMGDFQKPEDRLYPSGEGPVPPTPPAPAPPDAWYQSYGRYAAPKMAPMYDDGGTVPPDPNNLPQEAFDPNAASAVGQSAIDSAATAAPESGMHKFADKLSAGGKALDGGDPSSMPGQTANTHQYGVQGLDTNHMAAMSAPMYDDGGKVKMDHVPGTEKTGLPGVPKPKDPVLEEADRQEKEEKENEELEQRNAVQTNLNTIQQNTQPMMMNMYDDGGPVKNDPNDGHHQMAVLEEGERVLTPEQNAAYEQEHGVPLENAGGRVLQQPNPPVHPMMDTEHTADQPVGQGKMDTSNPPAAEVAPPMMREMSNKVQPSMAASPKLPAPNATAPAPAGESAAAPKAGPNGEPAPAAGAVDENGIPAGFNSMATTSAAKPLPSERDKLEAERSALKQKMVDAAEGKFNNGKFDHIAYGEAKMALADLNKAHPWGQPGNHEGMLGKIGHGLAVAGNIAGEAVIPNLMPAIPGSRANLNAQEGQGQQQIKQGLEQKASEAETGLKTAQTEMAGRPKDPKTGIAFETFNLNHTAPGTPEHERAAANLAAYQEQDRKMNENKLASKPELLPQDIAAQTRKVLSLPKGTPERQQAEEELAFMEKQAQQSGKLTDRHREINDYAIQHGLNPDDPDQYAQAVMGYEKTKTAAKAEGGLPVWKSKAAIQNEYSTQRALLVQQNADANMFAKVGAENQYKNDVERDESMAKLQSLKRLLAEADENTVASNIIPMMQTLNIVSNEGKVKRLNPQELQALSPAQGSLYRWAAAHADRIAAGQLPDGYKAEIGQITDELIKEANEQWKFKTVDNDRIFGEHGQTMDVQNNPKGGTSITPKKATPNAPQPRPEGIPAGATKQYKDPKTNKVVGYELNGHYHALPTKTTK